MLVKSFLLVVKNLLCYIGLGGLLASSLNAEPKAGVNVNPANLAVLLEWEKFTGRQAEVIGDNLSADSWAVYLQAASFQSRNPEGAIAQQLYRWASAFDGSGILESAEGGRPYPGKPLGDLEDYVVELAIPIFPSRLEDEQGDLVAATSLSDRWQMGDENNRHHREAKKAFRALAKALVAAGMEDARLRLGWEFTGDWFPWSIDPNAGELAGSAEQFKDCWKFIYLTMEEVNPKFKWVWCGSIGFDHFDPTPAFPQYPGERFTNHEDNQDKMLVDFVGADLYDADGEVYYREELMPGYWNAHEGERKKAFEKFTWKVMEGKGSRAGAEDSKIYGLRYFQMLAQEKGLPFVVSEWGLWANFVPVSHSKPSENKWLRSGAFGGDDNPDFITGFFDWTRANKVESTILFEFYNGGQGDTIDHTLLPSFWNTEQEGRPRVSAYPESSPFFKIKNQLHPQAARAYLQELSKK